MFLLREGSANTEDPCFIRLPQNTDADTKKPQLLFFPEKNVAKWFYESGMAEKHLIQWICENFIQPTMNFLDIGAHVGTYSWTCGKIAAHTFSFECSPKTFCYLCANIALQGLEERISPYPFALGNREGEIDYYVRSEDGGGNGVKMLNTADTTRKTIKIPMKPLDSFGFTNIGFIKIDVEGFEKEVLEGAVQTLQSNNYPKILFECWGDWKQSENVDTVKLRTELFTFLQSLGYRITPIRGLSDMYLAEHI